MRSMRPVRGAQGRARSPEMVPTIALRTIPFNRQSAPIGFQPWEKTSDYALIKELLDMSESAKNLRRGWKRLSRLARELRMIGKGLASTSHPILAHIIPMRRCNLSCTYCNEYDDH